MASYLTDIFVYSLASVVDKLSYGVFQLICYLLLGVYYLLRLPSFILLRLLKTVLLSLPNVLDSIVSMVANMILSSLNSLANFAYYALRSALTILFRIVYDLLGHFQVALYESAVLSTTFLMTVGKLTGLSLYSVGQNFAGAVYDFIRNM